MNIGFIWHSVYPWDVRLEKVADACLEAGHSVTVVCKGTIDLAKKETVNGAQVFRVFSPAISNGIGSKVATYPVFFNPVWRSQTLAALDNSAVDVIVVRDLPLANLALWAGDQLRKPVLIDMAENYPAALVAYQKLIYRPFLFNNAWLPRKYEELALRRVDHILVVAEEQRRRLMSLGVDPERITIVGNTPVQSFIDAGAAVVDNTTGCSRDMNLLYVGNLDKHRGADLLIRALSELKGEFPRARLTLVGDGNHRESLISLTRGLHLEDAVNFTGRVEWSRIADFIRRSTICLIPHLRSEHTDTTLPNKLFDYMAFSKPVVASDCAPLKRIIEQEQCGDVFHSGDVDDLVATLRRTATNSSLAEMGKNGRAAVESQYNWNLDKTRFLTALECVSRTATTPSSIRNICSTPAAVSA
jgi:glycosyltransferase involved in cell wall biosynthesis